MKYLFDTDHITILQRQTGLSYSNLSRCVALCQPSDFAVSTVTFHEQMLGAHTYINRAKHPSSVVKGYEMMSRLVSDFKTLSLLSFDIESADIFEQLRPRQIQLAKMDARIAAIALRHELILLTRNRKDFSKVAGLTIEDWTA